jgi:hypothetical protein
MMRLAVAIVTVPIYVHHVGDARYGVISIVWILLGYFGFLDLGLSRASTNALSKLRDAPQPDRARVLLTTMTLNFFLRPHRIDPTLFRWRLSVSARALHSRRLKTRSRRRASVDRLPFPDGAGVRVRDGRAGEPRAFPDRELVPDVFNSHRRDRAGPQHRDPARVYLSPSLEGPISLKAFDRGRLGSCWGMEDGSLFRR